MRVKNRFIAFSLHLLISVAILVVLLSVIFLVWFPGELIFAGGINGLKILIAVDLVLGPALTLIVFSPKKKSLKFDLAIIGLVQVGCLIYGGWLVYSQRPVLQVLSDDGVHLITDSDIRGYNIEHANILGKTPKKVMFELPDDLMEADILRLTSEASAVMPFVFQHEYYRGFNGIGEDDFQKRISRIRLITARWASDVPAKIENSECVWVPVLSSHIQGFACFDLNTGVEYLSDIPEFAKRLRKQ